MIIKINKKICWTLLSKNYIYYLNGNQISHQTIIYDCKTKTLRIKIFTYAYDSFKLYRNF